jgi:hypothetical protein
MPACVRSRALSVYLFVFSGGMAAGSALWGAIRSRVRRAITSNTGV